MAHTNQTAHYHLPQYVGTDIINPLTDTNKAYEDIDTALYEQGQGIAGVVDDIDALKIQNGDSALNTTAQTLSGAVNELKSDADALGLRVTANETNIGTLQTQMSTATGNITTLNTTVGGLQTEVASKASATALDNLTTKVGTGNLDTVAQNCVDAINEVKAAIPSGGGTASSVSYDGTTSGLSATNVQDAIDELSDAENIKYANTSSGLTATDVQSAIDEVAGAKFKTARGTSSGTTFGANVTALKPFFDALSADEKREAYIVTSNNLKFNISNILGVFDCPQMSTSSAVSISTINLYSSTYVAWQAGSSSATDLSSTASAVTYTLYA